jgi:hypothetical protein
MFETRQGQALQLILGEEKKSFFHSDIHTPFGISLKLVFVLLSTEIAQNKNKSDFSLTALTRRGQC